MSSASATADWIAVNKYAIKAEDRLNGNEWSIR